ncbi:MAG: hypothetical protein NC218_12810, partial [Acetobacter sp.]|nr:hypothetical protein [Acetobacter sp.]
MKVSDRELTLPMLSISNGNNSNVSVNLAKTVVNLVDGSLGNMNLGVLSVGIDSEFKLDVELESPKGTIDTISVGSGSSGVIRITQVGDISKPDFRETRNLKVLNRVDSADENGSYGINLKLDENLVSSYYKKWTVEDYENASGDEYVVYDDSFIGETGIGLNSSLDTIIFGVLVTEKTLHQTNIYSNGDVGRRYEFHRAGTVEEAVDLGETGAGEFRVLGATSNASDSVISLGGSVRHSGFDLENETDLSIENVSILGGSIALLMNNTKSKSSLRNVILSENVLAIENRAGELSLDNVEVSLGTSSEVLNEVKNASQMSIKDSSILSSISNSGVIETSGTNIINEMSNSGEVKLFGTDSVSKVLNDVSGKLSTKESSEIEEIENKGILSTLGNTTIGKLTNSGEAILDGTNTITTLENSSKVMSSGSISVSEAINIGTLTLNGSTDEILKLRNSGEVTGSNTTQLSEVINEASGTISLDGSNTISLLENIGEFTSRGESEYGKVLNSGVLNLRGSDKLTGEVSGAGQLKVYSETELSGSVLREQSVYLDGSSVFSVTSGTMNLDSNDEWQGKVVLSEELGSLNYYGLKEGTSNGLFEGELGNLNILGSELNLGTDSYISESLVTILSKEGKLIVSGGELSLNTGDNWLGGIELRSGEMVYSDLDRNGSLQASGGSLTIKSGNLHLSESSEIASGTLLSIEESGILTLSGGRLSIENQDEILGTIVGEIGELKVSDRELTSDMLSISDVHNKNVSVLFDNVQLSSVNNEINNLNLGVLTTPKDLAKATTYELDISIEKQKADTITVASGSAGTILLTKFYGLANPDFHITYKFEILKRADGPKEDGTFDINLELTDELKEVTTYNVQTYLENDIPEYVLYNNSFIGDTGIKLNDTLDSIIFGVMSQIDTLYAVNIFDDADITRSYSFVENTTVVETDDLGVTGLGKFVLNGFDNSRLSTIDMSGNTAFVLDKDTKLEINNLTIQNASNAIILNNDKATANLKNVEFKNNSIAIDNKKGSVTLDSVIIAS